MEKNLNYVVFVLLTVNKAPRGASIRGATWKQMSADS